MYDASNGIFSLDVTDHYPIFTIVPINCPQNRICVKFRDHSGLNIARFKLEVERYFNAHALPRRLEKPTDQPQLISKRIIYST